MKNSGHVEGIKYRIFGHDPIYTIKELKINTENVDPFTEIKRTNGKVLGSRGNLSPSTHPSLGIHNRYKSQFCHPPAYQLLSK
jgi:hypothetical protein